MKRKNKGISLIVLVITIIVMIILATTVVLTLANNGILLKAEQAKTESDIATIKTQAEVIKAEGLIDARTNKETLTQEKLVELLNQNFSGSFTDGNTVIVENTYDVMVNDKLEITVVRSEANRSLEGEGQEFHKFAPTDLTFRSLAKLEDFEEVKVNGETVDPSNYILTEGSTIVTLKSDYLKTLGKGTHEITVVSKTGARSTNFDVVEPEKNSYGFYYNQPYTGYVSYYDQSWVFFLREDGTMDVIVLDSGYTEVCSYTFENNVLTISSTIGTFTGTVSEAGIYCNELATTFELGNESITADEDYIYFYDEYLGGYKVTVIDKTKSSYAAIRTDIFGKPTLSIRETFKDCDNLTSIPVIPSSITNGEYAFSDCDALINITMPCGENVDYDMAFYNCKNLSSVIIPASAKEIPVMAFKDCTNLSSVIFEDNSQLLLINTIAFEGCENLKQISIPDGVMYADLVGSGLESVVLPASLNSYEFTACRNLSNVYISSGITVIPKSAFSDCTNLVNITIPNTVKSIEDWAFSLCENLTSIVFDGTVAQWNAITKVSNWNSDIPATEVVCSNGTVSLI